MLRARLQTLLSMLPRPHQIMSADGLSVTVDLDQLDKHILCPTSLLNLQVCVGHGGQAFTWQVLDEQSWCNIIDGLLIVVSCDKDSVFFQSPNPLLARNALVDYFRLRDDLDGMYKDWMDRDAIFQKIAKVRGVRVLRIDPWECLFSFICSQNNSIHRILNMVQNAKNAFGSLSFTLCADSGKIHIYSFPTISQLRVFGEELEEKLRVLGFGYRSKYITGAIQHVQDEKNLSCLRTSSYEDVIAYLLDIPGVGPKVADCVALYGLDQLSAVPIDTHMLRIALSHYYSKSLPKSLTSKVYKSISQSIRKSLGPKAGWAQAFLFTSQLSAFKNQTE